MSPLMTPTCSTGCQIDIDGTCRPSDGAGLQRRSPKASVAPPVQQYEGKGAAAPPTLKGCPWIHTHLHPHPYLDHGERVVNVEEGSRQGVTGTR